MGRAWVATRSMRADAIDIAVIDASHFRGFVDEESDTAEGGAGHHWWKGRHDRDGYGIYSLWQPATGKVTKLRAHRVAHALAHGGLPAGVHVLHCPGCETPGCCNAAHTYRGDAAANAGDRDRPGRKSALTARRHQAAGQDPLPGMGWEPARSGPGGPQRPGQTQTSRVQRSTQSAVWTPPPSG